MDAASSSGKPYFSKGTSSSGALERLDVPQLAGAREELAARLPPWPPLRHPPHELHHQREMVLVPVVHLADRGSNSRSPVVEHRARADQTSAAVPCLAPNHLRTPVLPGWMSSELLVRPARVPEVHHAALHTQELRHRGRRSAAAGHDGALRFPAAGQRGRAGSESDAPGLSSGRSACSSVSRVFAPFRTRLVSRTQRSTAGHRRRPRPRHARPPARRPPRRRRRRRRRASRPRLVSFSTHRATAAATTASIASAAPSVFASASTSASAMMASSPSPGAPPRTARPKSPRPQRTSVEDGISRPGASPARFSPRR